MIKPVRWSTRLDLLSPQAIDDIHLASLRILERTGLAVPLGPERRTQAADMGLLVERDTGRVRFPPAVVETALKSAPRRYTLCARDPANDVVLDGRHGYMCLDGCGTQTLDIETGSVRNSTKADLQAAAGLADALPQISFLWPVVSAQDCPAKVQPLHELEALLAGSSKHVQAMTAVNALSARGTVDMAAEVAGGRDALRARPIVSALICSSSPLAYAADALEAAFVFGEAGISTGFMCMPIGCATAPATVGGTAVLANAEVLAGIVLFELFFPGVPTFYGSCATMLELRTGGITSGAPEDCLLQAAACGMARHYGVPANIGTFAPGAKASDWQAGVENALSGAVSQFSGADMMCGAGLLNCARIFSFEQLLMDCEIYDMLRVAAQGFVVDEDALALDMVDRVGPGGSYLATKHTRSHMTGIWQPAFAERGTWESWVARDRPAPDEIARQAAARFFASERSGPAPATGGRNAARNEMLRLLDDYRPQPLECAARLSEIIAEYERM